MQTLWSSRSVTPHLDATNPFPLTCSPKGVEAGRILMMESWAIITKYRNIDLLSIGYAFQPDLRTD